MFRELAVVAFVSLCTVALAAPVDWFSDDWHYRAPVTGAAIGPQIEVEEDTYRHDAWGKLLARSGTSVNPYRYAGAWRHYDEPETGLQQVGLRYLSPALGPGPRSAHPSPQGYVRGRKYHIGTGITNGGRTRPASQ